MKRLMNRLAFALVLTLALVVSAHSPAQTQTSQLVDAFTAAKNGAVLVAAHRGGYADDKQNQAPENSLANLRLAIQKGYDVYETDIQRTADGVFVIVHDPTLARETNSSAAASDLTLTELKQLHKRYRDKSLSNERIATLDELLRAGKGKILFKPDLKPGMIDHFDEIARLISDLGMADQVFLRTGFKDAGKIKDCFKNGCPKVEVMFKTKSVAQVQKVIGLFHPKTIQVDLAKDEKIEGEKARAIRSAVQAGVLVETHSYRDPIKWSQLHNLGVRMFHTGTPDATIKFLQDQGWRKGLPSSAQQSNPGVEN